MFNFICELNSLPHLRRSYLPLNNFLSRALSSSPSLNKKSFVVNYLINSCGFDQELAISASKRLGFKTPDNPDSVLALFKNHGFSHTQILAFVKKYPRILCCNPQKTLLPKLEFLSSIGLSRVDIVRVVSWAPNIMRYSMEQKIIPSYKFFRDLLKSDERTVSMLKRFPYLLTYDLDVCVAQNIRILRDVGVPESKLIFFVTYHSKSLRTTTDNFRKIVEDVKEMGFKPSLFTFLWAFQALKCMSTLTLEKKVEVYKRWGWSANDVQKAFKKYPLCMSVSEDKIDRVMDFFVNEMHIKPSLLVSNPILFSLSLEKRVIPRCLLYQVLLDKGLIKKEKDKSSVIGWAIASDISFIKRVRKNAKEEAPQLLQLYQSKVNSANLQND